MKLKASLLTTSVSARWSHVHPSCSAMSLCRTLLISTWKMELPRLTILLEMQSILLIVENAHSKHKDVWMKLMPTQDSYSQRPSKTAMVWGSSWASLWTSWLVGLRLCALTAQDLRRTTWLSLRKSHVLLLKYWLACRKEIIWLPTALRAQLGR